MDTLRSSWVNPYLRVQESLIHGRGTFATNNIKKGTVLMVQGGTIILDNDLDNLQEMSDFFSICFQIERGFHICPLQFKKMFVDAAFCVNHSCNPNTGVDGQVHFVALRDIKRGEEIVYDYAMTDANYPGIRMELEEMICECGAPNCRKMITGNDWKKANLQKKYGNYFSRYILKMIYEA